MATTATATFATTTERKAVATKKSSVPLLQQPRRIKL